MNFFATTAGGNRGSMEDMAIGSIHIILCNIIKVD